MTIKELKEIIKDMPDDMRIYADNGKFSMFEDVSEFVFLVTDARHPKMAILQSKADIDVEEELRCIAEIAVEEGWSDDEFYREILDRGFTADDFPDPEKARADMEYYGLI